MCVFWGVGEGEGGRGGGNKEGGVDGKGEVVEVGRNCL